MIDLAALADTVFLVSTKLPICTASCRIRAGTQPREGADARCAPMLRLVDTRHRRRSRCRPDLVLRMTQFGPTRTPSPSTTSPSNTHVDIDFDVAAGGDFAADVDPRGIHEGDAVGASAPRVRRFAVTRSTARAARSLTPLTSSGSSQKWCTHRIAVGHRIRRCRSGSTRPARCRCRARQPAAAACRRGSA